MKLNSSLPERRRLRRFGLGLAVAAMAGLGLATMADADEFAGAHAIRVRQGDEPMAGMPGLPLSGPMFEHMMDELKATPEQRSQLQAIGAAARADLKPQMKAAHEARGEWMQLFSQPTVDPAAAEALRQKMLAHHDAVSRRMTQALLEASQVLSPEQRRTLAARLQEQMPHHMKHMPPDAAGLRG